MKLDKVSASNDISDACAIINRNFQKILDRIESRIGNLFVGGDIETEGTVSAGNLFTASQTADGEALDTGFAAERIGGLADGVVRRIVAGVGSGGKNAGIWDTNLGKWLVYSNGTDDVTKLHQDAVRIGNRGITKGASSAFVHENITAFSSTSIAAVSNKAGTVNVEKSGYTAIGVVGYNMSSAYCSVTRLYLEEGQKTVYYQVSNPTSSARTASLTIRVLYAVN